MATTFDFYVERDQLEAEFSISFAVEPQVGDTIDCDGRTWLVTRRHFESDGHVCFIVHQVQTGRSRLLKNKMLADEK